ncbi:TBC1 domain, member 5 [Nowakowskiella sp. JEL0407]|nr:TBC1 domain, member 5 [Nowakowskiella sp. JEL0407]
MRSFGDIKTAWDAVFPNNPEQNAESIHLLKQKCMNGEINDQDFRSLYWKLFMNFFPGACPETSWVEFINQKRHEYQRDKERFLFDPSTAVDRDYNLNNPLSLSNDVNLNHISINIYSLTLKSPWTQYFKDEELQKLIKQDVERTFPDSQFFRNASTQLIMTHILFVWCKLHEKISYRQGMHEILAPILFVVDNDKLELGRSENNDLLITTVFDPNFVEHDAAILFFEVMKTAKLWYDVEEIPKSSPKKKVPGRIREPGHHSDVPVTPIITICRKIQNDYLRALDYELHLNLNKHGIEPQIYGLRWLRLLFGREFPIPHLYRLWDGIFASDEQLKLAEWIAVAILIHMKADLMNSDMSIILQRLMRFYPMDEITLTPSDFIKSAIAYREKYNEKISAFAPLKPNPTNIDSQSPSMPPTPVQRKPRNNVQPWVNHTNISKITQSNQKSVVSGDGTKKSDTQKASYPPAYPPRKPNAESPSESHKETPSSFEHGAMADILSHYSNEILAAIAHKEVDLEKLIEVADALASMAKDLKSNIIPTTDVKLTQNNNSPIVESISPSRNIPESTEQKTIPSASSSVSENFQRNTGEKFERNLFGIVADAVQAGLEQLPTPETFIKVTRQLSQRDSGFDVPTEKKSESVKNDELSFNSITDSLKRASPLTKPAVLESNFSSPLIDMDDVNVWNDSDSIRSKTLPKTPSKDLSAEFLRSASLHRISNSSLTKKMSKIRSSSVVGIPVPVAQVDPLGAGVTIVEHRNTNSLG